MERPLPFVGDWAAAAAAGAAAGAAAEGAATAASRCNCSRAIRKADSSLEADEAESCCFDEGVAASRCSNPCCSRPCCSLPGYLRQAWKLRARPTKEDEYSAAWILHSNTSWLKIGCSSAGKPRASPTASSANSISIPAPTGLLSRRRNGTGEGKGVKGRGGRSAAFSSCLSVSPAAQNAGLEQAHVWKSSHVWPASELRSRRFIQGP